MEKIKLDTLLKYRKAFIDDVDVSNGIIRPLMSEYILKDDDVQNILNGKTKEERATILLDILPGRGPFAFDVLTQALKHHYRWLSYFMEKYFKKESGMLTNDASDFIDLPPVPPLSVPREEKINEFKQDLKKLKPGKHLALHGLKGFGKSCLTVLALKDTELVSELFENQIYWLKFSYTSSKSPFDKNKINEEILSQLNELYLKLKKTDTPPTPLQSESSEKCFIRLIKLHFSQHKNSLLVLDDVCNKIIVNTFNFGCKTLVITDDLSVIKHEHPITFEILDGFSESESLSLFAHVLNIDVDSLPPEAKHIHEACKGMPLLISMFAAEFEDFKDQMTNNRGRWEYYLKRLRKKDPKTGAIQKQTAIFDLCIDRLAPDLKKLYYELAIFNEDVNIMPKTLEMLWGVELFEVDEKMLIFCHKSLAARRWNEKLNSYVYGVHDLLLSHLRMRLSPQKLREQHGSFIKKNLEICKDNYSQLPDDNYSYCYFGYHLEEAQLYELFPKIYLNLEFVQGHVSHTSLSDMLLDFKKYKMHITRNFTDELQIKLSEIEFFFKSHMSVVRKLGNRNYLDIVQLGLILNESNFVQNECRELANKRTSDLYFSNCKSLGNEGETTSENFSIEATVDSFVEDISTLCFTDDPNVLLLALKNGDILLKNIDTKKSHYICSLRDKSIVKLVLSHCGKYFLALTSEGEAKLFCKNEQEENGNEDRSAREKQRIWTGVFPKKLTDTSLKTFSVENDELTDITFSRDDHLVAGCTAKATVIVWKICGELLENISLSHNSRLIKITFTCDAHKNIFIHVIQKNNGALVTYKLVNSVIQYQAQYNLQIRQYNKDTGVVFFKGVPQEDNSVILVVPKGVAYIKWQQSLIRDQIQNYTKEGEISISDGNTVFTAANVTYDGQFLILAKSDGFINVRDIKNNFALVAIYKGQVSSLDTYWMEELGHHLICGNENRLVHKFELKEVEERKTLNKPVFNVLMKPFGEVDMVARKTSENKIVVLEGNQGSWEKIAETDRVDGTIKSIIFTPDGSKVIYEVFKDFLQEIFMFNIETKAACRIMIFKRASAFIKANNKNIVFVNNENLRVWDERLSYLVPNTKEVISIHEVTENNFITVSKRLEIIYWDVYERDWQIVSSYGPVSYSIVFSSTISAEKSFLAVLYEDKEHLIIYSITKNQEVEPALISIELNHKKFSFPDATAEDKNLQITCFEFSKDEKYLAVGCKNGAIFITETLEEKEIRKLNFHSSSVCELHWAPSSIEVPILLSVNSDELIWWNVEPVLDQGNRRRSRMGLSTIVNNVVPSPRSSFKLKNIENGDAKSKSPKENGTIVNSNKTDVIAFWQSKIVKENQSGLLGLIPILSNTAKVFISEDFRKFLIMESTGRINVFEPFGLSDT